MKPEEKDQIRLSDAAIEIRQRVRKLETEGLDQKEHNEECWIITNEVINAALKKAVEAERAACEQVACNQVYSSTYPVDTGTVGVIADAIAARTKDSK